MLEIGILFALFLQGWFFFREGADVKEKLCALLSAVAIVCAYFINQQVAFQVATCLWLIATAYRLGLGVPVWFKSLDVAIFVFLGAALMLRKGFGWG